MSVSASGAASEGGPGEGWTNFRFDRSPYSGTSAPLTVYFALGGTAINGVDYEQLSNSVTFPFGVGVVGVQFKLDGAALGSEMTNAPYSVSWDTTTTPDGTHTLTAAARDAAGNQGTSSPVTVVGEQ